jgi:hypothetical protein
MRTFTRLAVAPSALILTAGLLAGCNDPNEDSGSTTETVSPDDTMEEDDSMEKEDDSMEKEEDETMEEDDDAMEDEG